MRSLITILSLVCVFGVSDLFGCLLSSAAVVKFDPAEFIFIGTVIGYTGPVRFDEKRANNSIDALSSTAVSRREKPEFVTYGLAVKVKDVIHLPIRADKYEIFEYSLGADCLVQGIDQFYLQNKFPLSSEVRVISKQANLITEKSANQVTRLENRVTEDASIALNFDSKGNRATSAEVIFDYKTYSYDIDHDSESKYLLPVFEVRKDLLRLFQLTDQKLRDDILDRIFYAPIGHNIDHGGIFKNHTSSDDEYRRYFETHLKATDPEFYLQYRAYQDALSQLLKLGYEKGEAEKALGKALETGTDIDATKLFNASLKYLPVRK